MLGEDMVFLLNVVLLLAVVVLYLRVRSLSDKITVLQSQLAGFIRQFRSSEAGQLDTKNPNPTAKSIDSVQQDDLLRAGFTNADPSATPEHTVPKQPMKPSTGFPSLADLAQATRSQPPDNLSSSSFNESHRTNADWEMLIGGNLFSKLGVLAIVISAGFALNYAFVNDLIGETMRIIIGFVGGAIILGGAHIAQRRNLSILAQSLVALGVSILYLTVYAMSQFYRMVPDSVATGLMLGVSGLTIGLALLYASQPVALMAAVGAYLTPILLGADSATAIPMLVYLLVISLAFSVLVWYKPNWTWLRVVPIIGTGFLCFVWYVDNDIEFLVLESIFIYMIWILYLSYDIYHHVIEPDRKSGVDIATSIINSMFVVFITIAVVDDQSTFVLAGICGALALVYGILLISTSQTIARSSPISAIWAIVFSIFVMWGVYGLDELYWGIIIVGLITLAFMALVEHYDLDAGRWAIGLFLLVNSFGLMIMGSDDPSPDMLIVNNRTLAYLLVMGGWLFFGLRTHIRGIAPDVMRATGGLVAIALGFIWLNIELETGFDRAMPIIAGEWDPNRDNWIELTRSAAWLVYSLVLFAAGVIRSAPAARYAAIFLFGLSILKIFLRDLSFLDTPYRIVSFLVLGLILLLVSYIYQRYRVFIFGTTEASPQSMSMQNDSYSTETKSENDRKSEY